MMQKTLIIGYGNADRQDDGVAWHVLVGLNNLLGRQAPIDPEDGFVLEDLNPELIFTLQLTPDMAELLSNFERVCFVDAHTANISLDIQVKPLQAVYQSSPFTHHMSPETLLAICQALYRRSPEAFLVSIRGYEFNFSRQLSSKTEKLAGEATQDIWNLLSLREKV